MTSSTEPYSILGINRTASSAQIRKAYREMARKYHPDKLDIPQAKQLFHTITLAYEMLSDPNKKKQYDELVSKRQQQHFKNGKNIKPKPDVTREKKETKRQMPEQKSYQQQQKKRSKQFYFQKSKQFEEVNQFFKDYCKKHETFKRKTNYFASSPSKFSQPQNYESKKIYKVKKNSSPAAGNTLFLFIFIFIFWYFMPKFSFDPQFKLTRSQKYSLKLKTNRLKIPFFVQPSSLNGENSHKISEDRIQRVYIYNLQITCQKNLSLKSLLQSTIAHVNNRLQRKQFMKKFNSVDLKSCKKLIKIMRKHPEVKLRKFGHKMFS